MINPRLSERPHNLPRKPESRPSILRRILDATLHALHAYERHYNTHRPHRGISNARPLRPLPKPITDPAAIGHLHIHRHDRIGGLLHEYEHAA